MNSNDVFAALMQARKNTERLSGFQGGVHTPDDVYERNWKHCYAADNNFAYKKEVYDADPTPENKKRVLADCKMFNFVPTYDRWCLRCDNRNDVTKRCSKCHGVFFCNVECQQKAWKVHKQHCGRDLFAICAKCGDSVTNNFTCDGCPVKWCSEHCREEMLQAHRDFDCENLNKLFGKKDSGFTK